MRRSILVGPALLATLCCVSIPAQEALLQRRAPQRQAPQAAEANPFQRAQGQEDWRSEVRKIVREEVRKALAEMQKGHDGEAPRAVVRRQPAQRDAAPLWIVRTERPGRVWQVREPVRTWSMDGSVYRILPQAPQPAPGARQPSPDPDRAAGEALRSRIREQVEARTQQQTGQRQEQQQPRRIQLQRNAPPAPPAQTPRAPAPVQLRTREVRNTPGGATGGTVILKTEPAPQPVKPATQPKGRIMI